MNIFRKFYLSLALVYVVNSLTTLPIFQQEGPSTSNEHRRSNYFNDEGPMSTASTSQHDQNQSGQRPFNTENTEMSDAEMLINLHKVFSNYNTELPPNSKPITVDSSVRVLNIPTINPEEMTLKIYMEIRQSWSDARLLLKLPRPIQLPDRYYDILWNPNTIVLNANSIQRPSVYMRNNRLKVDTSKGKITHIFYVHAKTSCLLDMTDYPYDEQECEIQFGSEAYNAEFLTYLWSSLGTGGIEDVGFSPEALATGSEFRYKGFNTNNDSIQSSDNMEAFSRFRITLYLSRNAMFPFYSFTLPFTLIVFLAFLPPFLGPEALIGRITFGATTFIGSLGLLFRRPLGPTVDFPYLSALDVYAGLNMLLTFGSLVESCVIGAILSNARGHGDQKKNKKTTKTRRSQERLGSEVDTTMYFAPAVPMRMGKTRVKIAAISKCKRNFDHGLEHACRNEEYEAAMRKAVRIDGITKIVYAIASLGSILTIHLYYRISKESLKDMTRVNTP